MASLPLIYKSLPCAVDTTERSADCCELVNAEADPSRWRRTRAQRRTRDFMKIIERLPTINQDKVQALRGLLAQGKIKFDEDEVARKFIRLEALLKY